MLRISSIQVFVTCKTRLTMKNKLYTKLQKYLVSSLFNAQQTIMQILEVLGHNRSTISRELCRTAGRDRGFAWGDK